MGTAHFNLMSTIPGTLSAARAIRSAGSLWLQISMETENSIWARHTVRYALTPVEVRAAGPQLLTLKVSRRFFWVTVTARFNPTSTVRRLRVASPPPRGDFNNDGKIDLTSALGDGDIFNVSDIVGLGNGDGTFTISYSGDDGGGQFSYAPGQLPFVAAADLNGDGNLDFIVCNAGNVSVLLGNGDGTFQTPIVSAGGCGAAALGDFHGNGFLDLATSYAVFTGNGTGEFPESGDVLLPHGNQPVWVSAADFNGDGKLDVVLANSINTIWVDLQSGNAGLSPTSLSLSSYIGITSAPQTVTLSNTAGVGLAISVITASTGFAQTNNCPVGGSLPPGSSCAIKVTFTPTASGTASGTVSITDNGPGSPQPISLTGEVQDFAIATTGQASLTVTPGQAANYAVSISPVNGFNQTVQLSCSGAPGQATCTVTPASVTLDGSKAVAANVAVVTTGAAVGLMQPYGGPPASNRLGSLFVVLEGWRSWYWRA
jgi:hypothetical protein